MADSTTTRSSPASRNFLTLSATCWILSTEPTEVPPNFCTIKAISKPPQPVKGRPINQSSSNRASPRLDHGLIHSALNASLDKRHGQGQGRVQGTGVYTTALCHVRTTTALPAHCRSGLFHQITGFELASQVFGYACNQNDLFLMDTAEQDHCAAEFVFQLIDQRQQRLAILPVQTHGQHFHALDVQGLRRQVVTRRTGG